MLTDLTNSEGYIYVEAHPEYYDSAMSLAINTETKEFEICDGGGQRIDTLYKGTADYSTPSILILNYKREDISKTDINHTITFRYTVTKQTTKHFDGYGLRVSNNFVTFDDRSLLTPPDQPKSHPSDPLVFYTVDDNEDCDVDLYRAKGRIQRTANINIPSEFAQYKNNPPLADEILSKVINLVQKFMRDTIIHHSTILGASDQGILLYYDVREHFVFLSPTHMKVYMDEFDDYLRLTEKVVHTFEYDNTKDEETIKDVINLMRYDADIVDIKAFVEKVLLALQPPTALTALGPASPTSASHTT
jgi:hypothetical protein